MLRVWQCGLYCGGSILNLTNYSPACILDKRLFLAVLKDRCVVSPVSVQLSTLTAHRCANTHTQDSQASCQNDLDNVTSYYNSCITVELQWQSITMQYSTNWYSADFYNFPIQVPIHSLMKTAFVQPKHVAACYVSARHSFVMYSTWKPKDNYDKSESVFVVQFNVFMSLTSQFDVKYRY